MITLDSYLSNYADADTGAAISALAAAAVQISAEIRTPRLRPGRKIVVGVTSRALA